MSAEVLFSLILASGLGIMLSVKRTEGARKVLCIVLGVVLIAVGAYGLMTAGM